MARATINGADLFYDEQGSGEPVLFHHGYTGSHDSWDETVARLSSKYRCIVMDCRGAGDSEHTADGYTIAQYAADAVGLMDHLGIDKFTYVGHSMGGITGMQLGMDYADRLEKLVLVAPAPADGVDAPPEGHEESRALRAAEAKDELIRQRVLMNPRGRTAEEIAPAVDRAISVSDGHFEGSWDALVDFRPGDKISEIQTPTLMASGAADGLLAANLKDFQRLPNATLHVFSRVGHGVPQDVPDDFAAVLEDFLTHGVVNAETQMAKVMETTAAS
jgi:pimeloyl-ACP methyl ester carboxylesterase